MNFHLPGLVFEALIRGVFTFVNPHPSSGVSKRPLIVGSGAVCVAPEEYLELRMKFIRCLHLNSTFGH